MMKRKRADATGKKGGDTGEQGGTTCSGPPSATAATGGIVSYGILLYKRCNSKETSTTTNNNESNDDDNLQQQHQDEGEQENEIRFLLGLIPQRNWWTVFKGLPNTKTNDDDGTQVIESPQETALREFQEETSIALPSTFLNHPEQTLHGHVGSGKNKKRLVIYLQQEEAAGSDMISTSQFDISKVVKIDGGYMKGQPEIVCIKWLSYREAMDGIITNNKHAKIYKSQRNILEDAYKYLTSKG